jgi:hypothetical protein
MLLAQDTRPWQKITVPTVSEAAANFKSPPHEYGAMAPFTSWTGADPADVHARIVRDLDRLAANGIFLVNRSPGRRVPGEAKYLSPGDMDQFKFTVAEAAKRDMRLWIQDESDYPSGFAGGYITERYPQLGMQDIVSDISVHVQPGQTLTMPIPPDTLAIWATETDASQQVEKVIPIPVPVDFQLRYQAPNEGTTPNEPRHYWQVQFLRHIYLSSPTRNFNRADGTRAKDATYSIIDYLDPKATAAFLSIVEDTYWKAVGDQFGKTVLGFFGDEPDYSSGIPWTPDLLAEFKAQKGYDLTPYLPSWFDHKPIEGADRARADYYDVWSGIFRSSFFGEQANWAKAHNVEYLVHLNHEETMLALERSEGDYFRDERYVEVPGIDNLNQLIPSAVHRPDGTWDINNNFPKLASSAAHLFGRPQDWAEEGGGTGIDGKYQMDFQLVRGVNLLQVRVPGVRVDADVPLKAPPPPVPPEDAMIAWYANRAGYLMAIGRPAAKVALYHPGESVWLGGQDAVDADRSTTKLGWELFEHQVDWDYFDEQSLDSVATLENGGFKNLSGQVYKAIVLPSMTVITRTGLERLKQFAQQGGKVIFLGKTPTLILDRTFLNAKDVPDLSFATLIEPSGEITPRVIAALPKPDVKLDRPFRRLTYTHRTWSDGDLYFFFNESTKTESRVVTIAGHGTAQDWDLGTGEIHPMAGATADGNDAVRIPMTLAPYEAKVVVVGPLPKGVAAPEPSFAAGTTLAELTGDWNLTLNGKPMTTELKPWEELGTRSFIGPATYRKQFTVTKAPRGKQVYLEIGSVNDYARVTLNGKELGARSWQPYRWDATKALKPGSNNLVIEVYTTAAVRRFGSPPPPHPVAPAAPASEAGTVPAPGAETTGNANPRPSTGMLGTQVESRQSATPAASGLLGPVRLVVY